MGAYTTGMKKDSLFEDMSYGKIRRVHNVNAYVSAYIICNLSSYVNIQSALQLEICYPLSECNARNCRSPDASLTDWRVCYAGSIVTPECKR
jgi:hypothetical protein